MKTIHIDDDLYHYIASKTQHIGESASEILRRLVWPESLTHQQTQELNPQAPVQQSHVAHAQAQQPAANCDATSVLEELAAKQIMDIPKMVDRWLMALSVMHKYNSAQFAKVLTISGRNRTYFAQDKETLIATGSSTNPKNVPDSDYWVITNNNTAKKINMLKSVASTLGFSEEQIQQLVALFAPEIIKE